VIPRSVERRLGWRIDHIYGTGPIAEACVRCEIDLIGRTAIKPSDHAFVLAELDW
jgi:exodeoxyribonuclease-3